MDGATQRAAGGGEDAAPRAVRPRARRLRQRMGSESGIALVEFTLVLPVLLVFLFGMLEFGRVVHYWLDETHLANEAARLAAVNKVPGGGSLQGYIRTQLSTNELRNGGSSWVPLPAQVCISFPNGTSNVGDPVKVELTAGYHWLPFIASDIGVATSSIVGSSTMRLEQKPTNYAAGCA